MDQTLQGPTGGALTEPVAVSDRLPELRGMFERILCVARSSDQKPIGNIGLADRLIKAVVSWGASGAALVQLEPEGMGPSDEELVAWLRDRAESTSLAHAARRITRAADLLEQRHPAPVPVAIPGEEYHEDMGAVTWWRFPVDEPPWVGTPNDSDWPGYHTHFTPAPPEPATALPLPSGEVQP